MKKNLLVLLLLAGSVMPGLAQNLLDGVYVKENNRTRRVIPYTHLREADVMWAKRIWRVIDLNEKINAPLRYPKSEETNERKNLINVLMDAISEGSLTAWADEEWLQQLTLAEFTKRTTGDSVEISVENPETGEVITQKIVRPFLRDDVVQYRIKEEWFFDKQRSELKCRIIGICPMKLDRDQDGNLREGGEKDPLFHIYYEEARRVLAQNEVANRYNSAQRMTFEDIFQKRMFNSYIMKEDNVYNRRISDYKTNPLDQILESDRIKQDMINFEIDLWEY